MGTGVNISHLRVKVAVLCFFMAGALYSQETSVGTGETIPVTDSTLEAAPQETSPETLDAQPDAPGAGSAEAPAETLSESAQEKTVKTNEQKSPRPINQARRKVTEDFFQTPEDPSFLYETRYIPDHIQKEEFLNRELEREVIEERILEAKDFKETLEGIRMKLPSLTQVALFIGIILLFILYRMRLKKQHRR